MRRIALLAAAGTAIAMSVGCGSSSSGAGADAGPVQPVLPATLAVTADWLHHTLSLVDLNALVSGTTPGDAGSAVRVAEIDLSAYAQGPYTVKLTPDGKTAIVSLSAGFLAPPVGSFLVNAPTVPTGPSKVLFIDLASQSVTAELDTGDGATGIAITHDGRLAFVCHVGTSNLTVVDVASHQIVSQVDLGGNYAEEVAIDDSDTVGIITYLDPSTSQKNVRTFAVADMAASLSPPIPLNSDAAGVPFFPGTKVAYVVLAYNPLTSPASGYALIDATNPAAPVKLVQTMWTDATYINYSAIAAPARGTVLVPVASGGKMQVREYALGTNDVVLKNTFPVATTKLLGAFGAVIDAQSHMVLTMPDDRQLAVLDLTSGASFTVPWFTEAGPLGIALR